MKAKLTITIDQEIIPLAKLQAKQQGLSLSQMIENALRALSARESKSFSRRWRGKFRVAEKADDRFRGLAERYL